MRRGKPKVSATALNETHCFNIETENGWIVGNRDGTARSARRKSSLPTALVMMLIVGAFVGARALPLQAQSAAGQAPANQAPATQSTTTQAPTAQAPVKPETLNDWEKAAGGAQAFDVASVKQNKSGLPPSGDPISSNIPLGPQDLFAPTGGLLTATNMPLSQFMIFAYKLTPNQFASVMSQLPKWATTDRYDIQARVAGNPTKDQFRMMMQDLLADRFKLAIHYETKEMPVFVLVLDKPGKLGPQLQRHPDDAPCSTAPPAPGGGGMPPTIAGGFPQPCGAIAPLQASASGRLRLGARNMTMSVIATSFSIPQLSGVDRPIVDSTGLTGKYDFIIEFTPELNGPLPPGANFTPDPTGPTFQEALKEQLGLKLESQPGSVATIVVDHVEEPSEN